MTQHTEPQIQEALISVRFPDKKVQAAFERQLRAGDPGAWFVVAHKLAQRQD